MFLFIQTLEETLRLFNSTAVAPRNKPIDPRADPKYVINEEKNTKFKLFS